MRPQFLCHLLDRYETRGHRRGSGHNGNYRIGCCWVGVVQDIVFGDDDDLLSMMARTQGDWPRNGKLEIDVQKRIIIRNQYKKDQLRATN